MLRLPTFRPRCYAVFEFLTLAATFIFHPFILLIEVFVNMHILLLKEPRDGESGPDPYIKVDTLYPNALVLLFCSTGFIHEYTAVVSAALHFKRFTFHCKF